MPSNVYENLQTPSPQPARTEQVSVTPSQPTGLKPREKYKDIIYKFGITEVVFGVICCVLWLVSIILAVTAPPYCYDYDSGQRCYPLEFGVTYASAGVWCGVFPIISGAFAICIRKKPTMGLYTANMALSIIAAVMMCVLLIMSCIAASVYESSRYPVIRAPHILLGILSLATMVICTVHSAYCCAGTCCRRKGNHGTVMYTAPPQQYVQLPNGQLMLVQAQPMLSQNYPGMVNPPANFQPGQYPGAPMMATMMPPGTGPFTAAGVPVTAMPSQTNGAQATGPQGGTAPSKQQEAEMQQYPLNPPGYDANNA